MSVPINLLKWSGDWDVASTYWEYNVVLDTNVGNHYVFVGENGTNTATAPNLNPVEWIAYPLPPPPPVNAIDNITTGLGSGLNAVVAIPNATLTTNLVAGAGISLTPSGIDSSITIANTIGFTPTYGFFASSSSQTFTNMLTLYPINLNQAISFSGITPTASPTFTSVTIPTTGIYKLSFSAEVLRSSTSLGTLFMFPRVNGAIVNFTGSQINSNINTNIVLITREFILNINAGSTVEWVAYALQTGFSIAQNAGSSPTYPATPSFITTIYRIA